MSVPHALLALLSEGPKYGLRLQSEFESRTGEVWPLNVGQVYTTLQRLERDGLVESDGDGERVAQALPDHAGRLRGAGRLAAHAARARASSARRARDQGAGGAADPGHRRPRDPAGAPPARDRGHAALHAHQGARPPRTTCRWRSSPTRSSSGSRRSSAGSTRPTSASSAAFLPGGPRGRPDSPTSSRGGGLPMTSALELRRVSKVYGSGADGGPRAHAKSTWRSGAASSWR